ncbi:hypothetical protein B0H67DRAFT_645965 [Lasiosphaeris hirsuta]|uniref:Uncharacterized protein n=1 Tax=Lasiosphaeris hirsuta TaxID=260670 RepID=A0AA40AIF2_9PEZI|nr:hypothetical protein B0H67DRAFT_645965 [Lasiosphaeris hirsuta]
MGNLAFDVDLVPEGGDNATYNFSHIAEDDFRRIFYETNGKERSPLSMMVKLVEVHHGEMLHGGKDWPATLLIFEFRFQSRLLDRRYKSASVTLEFFDKGGITRRDPAVVDLSPDRMHYLNRTTYDRTIKYGAKAGAGTGNEPAGGEAGAHWDVELTKPPRFKATLTGLPGYSKNKIGSQNAVTWTMAENAEEDGIPAFLQTAVLLKRRYAGAFYARLRVQSEVDLVSAGLRALRIATDRDKVIDDVVLTPGRVQVRNSSATGIRQEDLKHMDQLPLRRYMRVNLSEEDPLTTHWQPAPATPPATVLSETTGTESTDPMDDVIYEAVASAAAAAASAATAAAAAATAAAAAAAAAAKAVETVARAAEGAAKAAETAARAALGAAEAAAQAAQAGEKLARRR